MRNRQSTLVARTNCFTKATTGLLVGLVAGSTGAVTPGEVPLLSNNLTQGYVDAYDPSVDYFPDKATITHAQAFTLEYFKHYKVLTVLEPWPDARDSFRYVLVQCGTPAPEPISGA